MVVQETVMQGRHSELINPPHKHCFSSTELEPIKSGTIIVSYSRHARRGRNSECMPVCVCVCVRACVCVGGACLNLTTNLLAGPSIFRVLKNVYNFFVFLSLST